MQILSKKGFTLIEIITVVTILGLLSTALYIGAQPYMKRSRDTKRITDVISYMNIMEAYNANFETFPSNYGSGSSLSLGYCLSELATRPNYVGYSDMQFQSHFGNATSVPPIDPAGMNSIAPCTTTGSYLYSRLDYGAQKQLALIAVRLEIPESANYGTGSDLTLPASVPTILDSKSANLQAGYPDSLYVIFRTR